MDPRRLLSTAAAGLAFAAPLGGCALARTAAPDPGPAVLAPAAFANPASVAPGVAPVACASSVGCPEAAPMVASTGETQVQRSLATPPAARTAPATDPNSLAALEPLLDRHSGTKAMSPVGPAVVQADGTGGVTSTPRPYLDPSLPHRSLRAGDRQLPSNRTPRGPDGRAAIAAANRQARAGSNEDAFVGGILVFAWDPGRVYSVWTAPLRVTSLTLAPGETVTAKAAGDTIRWQIGDGVSGSGATARTHILIKPLQAGLETNLVLTTNQRVYLLTLRSGGADAFNAAIAWDYGPAWPLIPAEASPDGLATTDLATATAQGPLDVRYRIELRGRAPRWAPTAVFNDGVRTFIVLAADVVLDEAPALFVVAGGEPQLVNYRQAGGLLIVDRVFDEAELRLGDRRPQIVRIRRTPGSGR